MVAPGVIEQQAHDLWRAVFYGAPERLLAATEAVIRRCDAALPMLPPSLLAEPLTVSRWDRFVREEALQPKRKGTAIEVLARRVRNALDQPNLRKTQLVIEAWLPDEDALRWVASASQDAVFQWFNDERNVQLSYWIQRPPFAPRFDGARDRCAYECSLVLARQILGDERALRAVDSSDDAAMREHARALADELREWRAAPADESDEAREIALIREQVALFLAGAFEGIARANGASALSAYSDAANWCVIANTNVDVATENSIIRRYYDAPDVEAWIATSS